MAKKVLTKVESTLPDEELNVPIVDETVEVPVVGEVETELDTIADGHEIVQSDNVTVTPIIEPVVVPEAPKVTYKVKAETVTVDRKAFVKLLFCLRTLGTIKGYIGVAGAAKIGELFGITDYEDSIKKMQELGDEFNRNNA